MPYIKHHPSLLAVHLSNNPGINRANSKLFSYILDIEMDSDSLAVDQKFKNNDNVEIKNLDDFKLKKSDLELL
jgi:hypothetical protein